MVRIVEEETAQDCKDRKGTKAEHWLGNNHLRDYPYSFKLCSEVNGRVYPYWSHELMATLEFGDRTSVFEKGRLKHCVIVAFDDESAERVLGCLLPGEGPSQPALL